MTLAALYFWQWTTYYSLMVVVFPFASSFRRSPTSKFIRSFVGIKLRFKHNNRLRDKIHQLERTLTHARCGWKLRSAVNTFIFYVAMILCYFPIIISLCLSSISYENWTKVWHLADTIAFLNSSINPILYCWRLRELRTAVYKTIKNILCTQTAQG